MPPSFSCPAASNECNVDEVSQGLQRPGSAGSVDSDILDGLQNSGPESLDFDFEPEPQVDIEAERREAYDEGYRAAVSELEARHAAVLQAMRDAHAAEIAALAEMHENEVVGMIHTRYHEMTAALSQTMTDNTLQVLLPVFDEVICSRSISNLASLTREALTDASTTVVVVRGPANLFEPLKLLFDGDGIECRFIETTDIDISVEINDLVLVTRLTSWAQALSEVNG